MCGFLSIKFIVFFGHRAVPPRHKISVALDYQAMLGYSPLFPDSRVSSENHVQQLRLTFLKLERLENSLSRQNLTNAKMF